MHYFKMTKYLPISVQLSSAQPSTDSLFPCELAASEHLGLHLGVTSDAAIWDLQECTEG